MLTTGQQRVERSFLECCADRRAHARAFLDNVVARDPGGAGSGRQERRQHQDGGRLAGAVRAKEAVDLAGLDPEIDAVDRARALLELANQAFDFDRVRMLHGRSA